MSKKIHNMLIWCLHWRTLMILSKLSLVVSFPSPSSTFLHFPSLLFIDRNANLYNSRRGACKFNSTGLRKLSLGCKAVRIDVLRYIRATCANPKRFSQLAHCEIDSRTLHIWNQFSLLASRSLRTLKTRSVRINVEVRKLWELISVCASWENWLMDWNTFSQAGRFMRVEVNCHILRNQFVQLVQTDNNSHFCAAYLPI